MTTPMTQWLTDFVACPAAKELLVANKISLVAHRLLQKEGVTVNEFLGVLTGDQWVFELVAPESFKLLYASSLEPSYLEAHQSVEHPPIETLTSDGKDQVIAASATFDLEANKVPYFSALYSAIHMLFIDRGKAEELLSEARAGKVSLESFVERRFSLKATSEQFWQTLVGQCQKIWDKNQSDGFFARIKFQSVGEQFLAAQQQGYLNDHRAVWKKYYKEAYCQKHPQDPYSCSTENGYEDVQYYNRFKAPVDTRFNNHYLRETTREWYAAFRSFPNLYSKNLTKSINQALLNATQFMTGIMSEFPHHESIQVSTLKLNSTQ